MTTTGAVRNAVPVSFVLMMVCVEVALAATGLEKLDTKLTEAAKKIADAVPKPREGGRKPVVAILPFVDSTEGVRKLGVLVAEKLYVRLIGAKHLTVVERTDLDKLRKEHRSWVYACFDQTDDGERKKTARILKADFLLLGKTIVTGPVVNVSLRLSASTTGAAVEADEFTIQQNRAIRESLSVVQPGETRLQPAPDVKAPPRLAYAMYVERRLPTGEVKEQRLIQASGILRRPDDQYQIRFTPSDDCFVYLFCYDSAGKAQTIFPMDGIGLSNRCQASQRYVVPDPDGAGDSRWFSLDKAVGTETVYVVATRAEFVEDDLGAVRSDMQAAAADKKKHADKVEAVTEVMQNHFETVKVIQFEHR